MAILPFGYIEAFDGVSLNTAYIKPMRCRLRGAETARILTLVNGAAINIDGSTTSSGRFPVEQTLEIMVHGSGVGTGQQVNSLLIAISAKQGKQGVLTIFVPNQYEPYYCQAIFDYMEIVAEGNMSEYKGTPWTIVKLVFQQLAEFY